MNTSTAQHQPCCPFELTQQGKKELVEKQQNLTARERQLLLLIKTQDSTSQRACEDIVQKIDLDKLIHLGLLKTDGATCTKAKENQTCCCPAEKSTEAKQCSTQITAENTDVQTLTDKQADLAAMQESDAEDEEFTDISIFVDLQNSATS